MTTAKLDEFKLISGEKNLNIYQWNSKIAKHYFCNNCGVNTHHQRRSKPNEYGVNVGCLEDFNMDYGIPPNIGGHITGVDILLNKRTQQIDYHQDISLS